jgi:hypothetical protein
MRENKLHFERIDAEWLVRNLPPDAAMCKHYRRSTNGHPQAAVRVMGNEQNQRMQHKTPPGVNGGGVLVSSVNRIGRESGTRFRENTMRQQNRIGRESGTRFRENTMRQQNRIGRESGTRFRENTMRQQ